ncbi:MAG: ABC transporter ATP-binding protein [Methanomassiliicoccales archaeon]|nr:ABC transporter ATP-binding protein [Methanomassiliicoccales archaeon]
MPAIVVEGLTKRYGDFVALDQVTFSVDEGTFFGCFGPNGAGKSTLLKLLTGQILPSGGRAEVLGMDPVSQAMEIKRRVGIVPEVESPPSYLTASEFLRFAGTLHQVQSMDGKVERWLNFFDLKAAEGTLCRDLSKGMRQKVMLAAAFIHEPKLLFLDEPFINLDPIYQRKLRDYLLELRDEGRTVFLCSHILDVAQRIVQDMVILDHGKVALHDRVSNALVGGEDLETLFLRLVGGGNGLAP